MVFVQDASSCDSEIRELRENQQELSAQLEQRQLAVQQLQGASDALDGDIERLAEQKQKVQNCCVCSFTCPFFTLTREF